MKKAFVLILTFGLLFTFGCNKANVPDTTGEPNGKTTQVGVSSSTDERDINNLFFFKPDIKQLNYKGTFIFDDIIEKDVKLNINDLAKLKDGIVYELKIDDIPEVSEDRLNLGYFYVQKDKIYKIEPNEENLKKLKDSGQLPDNSVIVCQEKEISDELGEETGLHQSLTVKGDIIEYHSYNDQVNTGYFETIVWEKEKGMISYRSGFGADRDLIELQLESYNKQESEEQRDMSISEIKENFYGIWEFTKPVTIYGLSPEETIEYMGNQFTYMPQFCRCGRSGLNNPNYSVEKLGRENLDESLKQFLENNNIKEDFVHKIEIFEDNGKEKKWDSLGSELYKIEDRIIVNIDGQLCELKRVFDGEVDNYLIDKDTVHIGQKIGSLTVKSIEGTPDSMNDITFTGEITVKCVYELYDTGYGYGCVITLDQDSRKIIPVFEDFANEKNIRINNVEAVQKLLTKESGEAEIVIDNYSIGEREIMISANLVRVISQ